MYMLAGFRRPFPLLLTVLVTATLVLGVVRLTSGGSQRAFTPVKPKSYAELVRANYKILSPAQSRRLLHYAEAVSECMAEHVRGFGTPRLLTTKITMSVPVHATAQQVLGGMSACSHVVGDPPPGASLVLTRAHAVELYLPKRCLLDRKAISAGSTTRS